MYATCSLDRAENEDVADAFEAGSGIGRRRGAGWRLEPWAFDDDDERLENEPRGHYRTLWPHRHGTDGFFIARWRVSSDN